MTSHRLTAYFLVLAVAAAAAPGCVSPPPPGEHGPASGRQQEQREQREQPRDRQRGDAKHDVTRKPQNSPVLAALADRITANRTRWQTTDDVTATVRNLVAFGDLTVAQGIAVEDALGKERRALTDADIASLRGIQ